MPFAVRNACGDPDHHGVFAHRTQETTIAKSLAERLSAPEQEKACLAEKEAKFKADGRKARNIEIYKAGGLVEKAGLLELEPRCGGQPGRKRLQTSAGFANPDSGRFIPG